MSSPGDKLWGGRFSGRVDPQIERFTCSFPFDRRLALDDLVGSLAHARMLAERGILGPADGRAVLEGLAGLIDDVESGELEVDGVDEDIHSWIERSLSERIGDPAKRLHTARSRNDQVGTALRLFARRQVSGLQAELVALGSVLLERASEHLDTVLPGYTHLQRGQPVSLAHHLLAHFWAIEADGRRLIRCHEAAGTSPLGAGALAGTPHPIDPERSTELLGFSRTFANSMFAVADRDYVVELSFTCSLLLVHLSRWAEEIVLWTSSEFGFAKLSDAIAKGSSIMPQKRNPEPAEILRGKAGRGLGDLVAHLVQLKGLPLTYNSDLQEDKEALFDVVDTANGSLATSRVLASGLLFDPDAMRQALYGSFVTATDLADWLVVRGVPFRSAHEQTGLAVKKAEELESELWELPLEALQECVPLADESVYEVLAPEKSLRAHRSAGGPAPERVREQLERARGQLDELTAWCELQTEPPVLSLHRDGKLLEDLPA